MAAFIAKQMVGSKLNSVKGALGAGDDESSEEKKEGDDGERDPEVLAAIEEAEEKRKDKHRKMEVEREKMRQDIRDKYGLKKKVEPSPDQDSIGRVGRQKKTPEEQAAEANMDDDDLQSFAFPKSLDEFTAKVSELPGKVANSVSDASNKCTLQ